MSTVGESEVKCAPLLWYVLALIAMRALLPEVTFTLTRSRLERLSERSEPISRQVHVARLKSISSKDVVMEHCAGLQAFGTLEIAQ